MNKFDLHPCIVHSRINSICIRDRYLNLNMYMNTYVYIYIYIYTYTNEENPQCLGSNPELGVFSFPFFEFGPHEFLVPTPVEILYFHENIRSQHESKLGFTCVTYMYMAYIFVTNTHLTYVPKKCSPQNVEVNFGLVNSLFGLLSKSLNF